MTKANLNPSKILLVIILLSALISRFVYLGLPMRYDESYTYLYFASYPLENIISNYSLPNNHIFHSILVHFSTAWFGIQPWAVRLPAFLAGIILPFSTFYATKQIFDHKTALISSAWIVSFPILIEFSTNARGYTIVWVLSTMILGLAASLIKKETRGGWIWLALLSALGSYTIPIMLYPASMVYAWLFLSGVRNLDADFSKSTFFRHFFLSGLGAVLLSLLLYSPVILKSGLASLSSNRFTVSLPWEEFTAGFPVMLANIWGLATLHVPIGLVLFTLVGFLISIIYFRRLNSALPQLVFIGLAVVTILLLIQRVNPKPRIFLFLVPFYLIWSAAGVKFLISEIAAKFKFQKITAIAIYVVVITSLGLGLMQALELSNFGSPPKGAGEQIALFLKDTADPIDLILIPRQHAHTTKYYLQLYAFPTSNFNPRKFEDFERVFVVFDPSYNQNANELIDDDLSARLELSSLNVIHQIERIEIIQIEKSD